MTKTKMTGCTCVGDVRLSALDIGHDLRLSPSVISLPIQFESVGYDADGETWLARGTRAELIAELRRVGYQIAD